MKQIVVKQNGKTVQVLTGISMEVASKMFKGAELLEREVKAPETTVESNSKESQPNYYLINLKVDALGYKDGEPQVLNKAISLHMLDMYRYPVEKDGKTQHLPMRASDAKEKKLTADRFIINGNWYTLDQEYLDKVYKPDLVNALHKLGYKKTADPVKAKDAITLAKAYFLKLALEQGVKIDEKQIRNEDMGFYKGVVAVVNSTAILEKLDLYRTDRISYYVKKRELVIAKAEAASIESNEQLNKEGLRVEDLPASMAQ